MKIFLSYSLSVNSPSYGDRTVFKRKLTSSINKGANANSEQWQFSNHLGTHVDAPKHFFENGKALDEYPPDFWFFEKPFLLDIPNENGSLIDVDAGFNTVPKDSEILLLKTGFHKFRGETKYWAENPGLTPGVAKWIRGQRPNIRAIGMDFLSATKWTEKHVGREAHMQFLDPNEVNEPVILIEDMDLSYLTPGNNLGKITVMPLMVEQADGAPCTVVIDLHD